jgi:PBP1b-binding outer membrane lipoprotein LpoB
MKKFFAIALVAAAVSFAACGSQETKTEETAPAATETPAATEETPAVDTTAPAAVDTTAAPAPEAAK